MMSAPSNPGVARMGGLVEGETVLYDQAGQRVHFQNGRVTAIDATASINMTLRGKPLLTMSEAGSVFHGDVYVKGNIYAQQDVMGGDVSLQGHAHSGVQAGGADTGKPGGGGSPPDDPKPENAYNRPPVPPWRKEDGSWAGRKGDYSNVRVMEASQVPEQAAEDFVSKIQEYFDELNQLYGKQIAVLEKVKENTSKMGTKFKTYAYSNGTFVSIRPRSASSSKTPDVYYTVDITGNDDMKRKAMKFKFPNQNGTEE